MSVGDLLDRPREVVLTLEVHHHLLATCVGVAHIRRNFDARNVRSAVGVGVGSGVSVPRESAM